MEEEKSLRFNNGKIQTKEIDPAFILGIGEVLTKSREKYPHYNWAIPNPVSVPYESLMRHLMSFMQGNDIDKESGCHHLLHCATNIMFMYHQMMNHHEQADDRYFKQKETSNVIQPSHERPCCQKDL